MKDPILRFEDGKIVVGGKNLLASSASLSIAPTLEVERVYGDFDPAIAGARTQFVNFAPTQNLKGQLDISFFISPEMFAIDGITNNIDRMFDIMDGMSESAINNNIVGRYSFNNMYLKSFGFDVAPFQTIRATASYDIYGSIYKTIERRFHKTNVDFAHSVKSFGELLASDVVQNEFEILNLKYNIVVNRKVHNQIRKNEHTSVNTVASGAVPIRVSVESIEKEMSIEANEIVENLNAYGDRQNITSPEGLADSSISVFLLSLAGDKIARFDATGKIISESLSIAEGQNARSNITIKEIVK